MVDIIARAKVADDAPDVALLFRRRRPLRRRFRSEEEEEEEEEDRAEGTAAVADLIGGVVM